jgi:hypothetical protein
MLPLARDLHSNAISGRENEDPGFLCGSDRQALFWEVLSSEKKYSPLCSPEAVLADEMRPAPSGRC